jgi:ankyrin repeat protein
MRDIDKELFAAAKSGGADAVAELLARGANAKVADFMGVTPLMVAVLRDHVRCVELLLPVSDAKAVDEEDASALIYVSQHMRLDCAKALVAASDVDQRDAEGRTAMDHAKGWGDVELLGLLEACRLAQMEAKELASAAHASGHATPASRL